MKFVEAKMKMPKRWIGYVPIAVDRYDRTILTSLALT